MVIDSIKRFRLYEGMHPLFSKAFAFLESYLEEPKPVGKYEILGDDLFALVQKYDTKTDGKMEAHDKYIDIQFVAKGEEKVLWAERDALAMVTPFAEGKDAAFFEDGDRPASLILCEGDFVIFYPNDAHKPALAVTTPTAVDKIVLKVKVN